MSGNPIQSEKAALRKSAKARRAGLSSPDRQSFSAAILARLLAHPAFVSANSVLAYASHGDEVATDALMSATLAQGKILLLPRVVNTAGGLALHSVSDATGDLAPGVWGLREPDPARCPVATVASADLIIVPGLAFAPDGTRLGHGKGYYDRLLAATKKSRAAPPSIALAFEAQMFDVLPHTAHDIPVDWIVTETRQIDCALYR